MRIPTHAGYAIAAAATIALLAGCSGSASGPTGSALPGASNSATSSSHSLAGPRIGALKNVTVAPGKITNNVIGITSPRHNVVGKSHGDRISPDKCNVVYLSDNANINIDVYKGTPPFAQTQTLTTTNGYGWGVGAGKGVIYAGQAFADQIDKYTACGTTVTATLVGGGGGNAYGIAVDSANDVYAGEWPATTIDEFVHGTGSPVFLSDPGMGLPYFYATDHNNNVYISGWDLSFTDQHVDKCTPGLTSCALFAAVPPNAQFGASFPGGVAVLHNGDVIVNNQYGDLDTFDNTGALKHTFTYASSINDDFISISTNKKSKRLWAADIAVSRGGGTAQSSKLAAATGTVGPFNGNTAVVSGGNPLGGTAYPIGKN